MRSMLSFVFALTMAGVAAADPAPRPAAAMSSVNPALNTTPGVSSSLARVARALERARQDESQLGLVRLAFTTEVFGTSPRPALLEGVDVSALAAAPFGSPSHQEWLTTVAPLAFRSTLPYRPLRPGGGW